MVVSVVRVAIYRKRQDMTNTKNYRLCGGTYFTLLLRARKQRMGVREHYQGMSDGMADPVLLMALAEIAMPDYRTPEASMLATVKSTTSRYKSCQANGGTYFPFSDGAVIASFDERIKTDYGRCLAAMNSYVADYIDVCGDTKKDEYLVKALVEVIASDVTIDRNQPFYVCEDGSTLTKAQICAASELCLQSFLLGIWHYIIVYVQDNKVGADTYDAWCPANGRSPRIYSAALGENSHRVIQLLYSEVQSSTDDCDAIPSVEAEIIEPTVETTEGAATQQVINNNPVFNTFNFNGPIGAFYNQVDTVVNNYGDKKNE